MKNILFIIFVLCVFLFISCPGPSGDSDSGDDGDTIVTLLPEIEVSENSNVIANGMLNYVIGTQLVGTSRDIAFTVKNTGNSDLLLNNTPSATLTGECFTLKSDVSSSTVKAGESVFFSISFAPDDSISYTGNIIIKNNDSDENSYNFSIVGTGVAIPVPEISVRDGSDVFTSGVSQYLFNNVIADGNDGIISEEINFIIENIGTLDLNITDISLNGTDKDDFDIQTDFSAPVIPSGKMSVNLKFDPLTVGIKNAVLKISSNDPDESDFTVNLTGEAVAVPAPDICIKHDAVILESGIGVYTFTDTGYGYESSESEFIIENTGLESLFLKGTPNVVLTGKDQDMFKVVSQPDSTLIPPTKNQKFKLKFTPTSAGLKTAVVNIQSNDGDEENYTFTVNGTGLSEIINIKQGGDSVIIGSGIFDFGNVGACQTGEEILFEIENAGLLT